jgi:hypothetical protein
LTQAKELYGILLKVANLEVIKQELLAMYWARSSLDSWWQANGSTLTSQILFSQNSI